MAAPRKRILYIDDDINILDAAKYALEATGKFEVLTSSNAREALFSLQKQNPDVIILDVMMPEMDGIEAFKTIRNIPKFDATPIIFMTTKAAQSDLDIYKSLGRTSVIVKPFDAEDLPYQVDLFLNQL